MKKEILLLVMIGLISHTWSAYAISWNPGKLMLRNGVELQGELNFNWKADIVQYRQEDKVKAYSIDQVSNFMYFDNQLNNLRKFVAINDCYLLQHGRPQFLEEIASGTLMVYRSLRITHTPSNAANFDMDGKLMKSTNAFVYVVHTGNEWLGLNEFYNQRWPQLMSLYKDDLKYYIKSPRNEVSRLVNRMVLICKYNALIAKKLTQEPSSSSYFTTDQTDGNNLR